MRILLIEDDDIIGEGIKLGLSKQNMAVDWFRDGKLGLNASDSVRYDAVILDLSLPGMDGLAILRQWRQSGNSVPVLILTARGTLEQRVEGLNLGADDYLSKPFALEELAARLHALVRRSHGQPAPPLCHGEVCLDTATRTVFLAGEPVSLSGKAVALVELFLQHKHQILSRETLEEKLYPWGEEVSSNAIEVHIHNIRRKLGNSFIRTVYGAGYRLGDKT